MDARARRLRARRRGRASLSRTKERRDAARRFFRAPIFRPTRQPFLLDLSSIESLSRGEARRRNADVPFQEYKTLETRVVCG